MLFAVDVMVTVIVVAKCFLGVVVLSINRQIVLMKMKHPHHEEHEQQTQQANHKSLFRTSQNVNRVRQQVKQGDAKHDPRYQAKHHLNAAVRQADHSWQRTSDG